MRHERRRRRFGSKLQGVSVVCTATVCSTTYVDHVLAARGAWAWGRCGAWTNYGVWSLHVFFISYLRSTSNTNERENGCHARDRIDAQRGQCGSVRIDYDRERGSQFSLSKHLEHSVYPTHGAIRGVCAV